MADNYLERKMEDMRNGLRSRPTSGRGLSGSRKGCVQFPFPPRKVMLVGIGHELALPMIRAFSKSGSKVAFIDSDKEHGTLFARNEGVRFHHLAGDGDSEIEKAFNEIIKAWRDVDIIITHHSQAPVLALKWKAHLDNPPIPRSYKGRLILLHTLQKSLTKETPRGESLEAALEEEISTLSEIINHHNIAINAILPSEDSLKKDCNETGKGIAEDVSRLCIFLSLTDNDSIKGNVIKISI